MPLSFIRNLLKIYFKRYTGEEVVLDCQAHPKVDTLPLIKILRTRSRCRSLKSLTLLLGILRDISLSLRGDIFFSLRREEEHGMNILQPLPPFLLGELEYRGLVNPLHSIIMIFGPVDGDVEIPTFVDEIE